MEIGLLGLDGNPGSGNGFGSVSVDGEGSKFKWASINEGFKQERSGLCGDSCRVSKMAKTDADFSPDSTALVLENSDGFLDKASSDADKLRFFCHSKPENSAFPYLHHMAAAHTKNAGYYYPGGLSASSGMYLLSGVRGPFTPSQWLELEQQALIYKYMKENEPIPLHLLIPIIKAFESAGLFGYNGGTFRPTSWGMGPFHLGYSTSTDPEPGRCRRTDGKKWRCARDAVANQKYCERHMNRGRHRSRKHVEGQQPNGNGHSVSKTDNSSTTTNMIPPSVLHGNNNSPSNNATLDINHHSNNQYQMNSFVNRMLVDGEKSDQGLQQANWSESSFSTSKYQTPCGELCLNGFGVPSQLSSLSPMGAADFMSSNSVPSDHLDMGLGVRLKGESHKQANWSPISYGPLGEALQSSTGENRKTSSGLNMLPKGWEFGMRNCQPSSSSPSGVLHKGALGSLSNSSAGSSPRADNKKMI